MSDELNEVRCPGCGSTEIETLEQDIVRQSAVWEVIDGEAVVVEWGDTSSWGDGGAETVGWRCADCCAWHHGEDLTEGLLVDDAAPLRPELMGNGYRAEARR